MNIHCNFKAVRILMLLLSSQHASGLAIYSLKGSAVEETSQSSDQRPRHGPSPLQKHIQRHEPRGSVRRSLHAFNRILIWAWVVSTCSTLCSACSQVCAARVRTAACATSLTKQMSHLVCAYNRGRLCEQDLSSAEGVPPGRRARESAEQGVQSHPAVLQQAP